MPTLDVGNFNIVCATLGGFITLFGLVSYLLKEKYHLSEALISTLAGLIFSPHATNLIRPYEYANFNEEHLETITLYFTRLVLGVQLVLAGVQLPSKYLWKEWRSLSILLGPGMCLMWISTSLLVWALVPNINILMALSVGACVTPTDPVLSNSIVKGKFADKHIPPPLQKIIIAESGANDGLGYPFLYLGLFLLKYTNDGGAGQGGNGGTAIGYWFGETWGYEIILSVVYGAVVGWIAKELLHWAEERRYVDRESFLVFAITLALFIVGTVGMIGSDDVLACFIAGNAFTWDDWFRLETEDDSLQPTIDMLLNVTVFIWFGAVCPWHEFVDNNVIPIYRLIPLGILVLLFRRLPMVLLFHTKIHQIEDLRRAGFVGFFGPIGVSAIFYLYVSREFLAGITVDGVQREDAQHLSEVMNVVIWFLAICSIVIHGLSIPVGKASLNLPRTISTALSTERIPRSRSRSPVAQQSSRSSLARTDRSLVREFRRRRPTTSERGPAGETSGSVWQSIVSKLGPVFNKDSQSTGKPEINRTGPTLNESQTRQGAGRPEISAPTDGRIIGRPIVQSKTGENSPESRSSSPRERNSDGSPSAGGQVSLDRSPTPDNTLRAAFALNRSIRFGDEPRPVLSQAEGENK